MSPVTWSSAAFSAFFYLSLRSSSITMHGTKLFVELKVKLHMFQIYKGALPILKMNWKIFTETATVHSPVCSDLCCIESKSKHEREHGRGYSVDQGR